jgi:hypothetical protein
MKSLEFGGQSTSALTQEQAEYKAQSFRIPKAETSYKSTTKSTSLGMKAEGSGRGMKVAGGAKAEGSGRGAKTAGPKRVMKWS